jgi:hypothetical protein
MLNGWSGKTRGGKDNILDQFGNSCPCSGPNVGANWYSAHRCENNKRIKLNKRNENNKIENNIRK